MPKSLLAAPQKTFFWRLANRQIIAVFVLIGLWYFLSILFSSSLIPSPYQVFLILIGLVINGEFFRHLGPTLLSTIEGFTVSIILGVFLGIVAAKKNFLGKVTDNFLSLLLYLPAIVVLYLVVLIIGIGIKSVFFTVTAVLMPEMAILFSRSLKSLDTKFNEVLLAYSVAKRDAFFFVILPQLAPSLMGMIKTGFAVSWKIVLLAEVLAQSRGIGYKIYESFSIFSITKVMAWLAGAMLVMWVIEFILVKPLGVWFDRWNRKGAVNG